MQGRVQNLTAGMAFAGRGGGGGGEEGFEMACMEEVRGHQRVYLRRADNASRASADADDWLIIDDHVRSAAWSLRYTLSRQRRSQRLIAARSMKGTQWAGEAPATDVHIWCRRRRARCK